MASCVHFIEEAPRGRSRPRPKSAYGYDEIVNPWRRLPVPWESNVPFGPDFYYTSPRLPRSSSVPAPNRGPRLHEIRDADFYTDHQNPEYRESKDFSPTTTAPYSERWSDFYPRSDSQPDDFEDVFNDWLRIREYQEELGDGYRSRFERDNAVRKKILYLRDYKREQDQVRDDALDQRHMNEHKWDLERRWSYDDTGLPAFEKERKQRALAKKIQKLKAEWLEGEEELRDNMFFKGYYDPFRRTGSW